MNIKRLFLVLAAFGALVVGVVAIAGAGAQENSPTATPSASSGTSDDDGDDDVNLRDEFKQKLADKLGVSVDELEQALKDTQIEMIDEAVANGRLDADKAEEIKQRIEDGDGGFGIHFGGPRHHGRPFIGAVHNFLENAADILGLETDDLVSQLRDGGSLADAAEAQGMDVETFKTQLLDAAKADLDEKVADGDITQEMADDIYARLSENIDDIVNKTHDGPVFGNPRFGPGPRGPFFERNGEGSGFAPPHEEESETVFY